MNKLKNFSFFSIVSIFIFLAALQCYVFSEQKTLSLDDMPLCKTAEEQLLWLGCGCPNKAEYTPSNLSQKEKEMIVEKAVSYLKGLGDGAFSETLTEYYVEKKDQPKALYWAYKGAERGSGYCMSVLRCAYARGEGVIQDQVESSKWAHLAAAKGRENEQKLIKNITEMATTNEYAEAFIQKGREKAKEWMEKHPEAFFDPN